MFGRITSRYWIVQRTEGLRILYENDTVFIYMGYKKSFHYAVFLVSACMCFSCMSARKLDKQLTSSQRSLKYLFDSNLNALKTSKPIYLKMTSSVSPMVESSRLVSGPAQIIPLL